MSRVYRATDSVLSRTVAIKIHAGSDPEDKLRFLEEAKIGASLSHDNIIRIYDFGEVDEQPFMVLEWLPGVELKTWLRSEPAKPLEEKLRAAISVGRALQYVHSRKIIYRDLKPENIKIDAAGRVVLMDFGIARRENLSLTRSGFTLGTPYYMAPEQIRGERATPSTDIYSFGVLLYELVTGNRLVAGETVESVFYQILNRESVEFPEVTPIPEELRELIRHCLQRVPERRPAKMDDVLAVLDGVWSQPARKESRGSQEKRVPAASPARRVSRMGRMIEWVRGVLQRLRPVDTNENTWPEREALTSMFHTVPAPENSSAGRESPQERMEKVGTEGESGALSAGTGLFLLNNEAQAPVPAALVVTSCANPAFLGRRWDLTKVPFRIGREGEASLPFDQAVSRDHAEICFQSGGYVIRDLASANGTFVNGRRLDGGRDESLLFGSYIRLGTNTQLTFVSGETKGLPDLTGVTVNGRYHLRRILVASAKSAVYEGEDTKLPQAVAVKILSPSLTEYPGYRAEFEREAKVASRLRHPAINRILDYGEASLKPASPQRALYLCMEYQAGGSLATKLLDEKAIPAGIAIEWLCVLSEGLAHVHRNRVVHGGIKPTAILIGTDDKPLLTDFAVAVTGSEMHRHAVIGAPAFLAPEQWNGNEPTPESDQYSLAAVFYLVLSGGVPFEGQEHPAVRKHNLLRGPLPLHRLAAQNARMGLPEDLSRVFEKALAVNPEERFAKVEEFALAARDAFRGKKPHSVTRPRVFISYRRQRSSELAVLIKQGLEHAGCEVFVDFAKKEAVGRFPEILEKSIATCDVFVCVLAKNTLQSSWVNREIELAVTKGKQMIPVFQTGFVHPSNLKEHSDAIQRLLEFEGLPLPESHSPLFGMALQVLGQRVNTLWKKG